MLPIHSERVHVSSKMQDTFGFTSHNIIPSSMAYRRVDDTFLIDNDTTISKLTDILNSNLQSCLAERLLQRRASPKIANDEILNRPTNVFSVSYAALQLQLAAIFFATALKDSSCMLHLSKGMMSDMLPEMQKSF
jgi:hypothetical protein